jgi:multicomponent Na+:H+ antiporter subunit F
MDITSLAVILLTVMSTFRIIIGPTIWDRLLGLNLVTTKLIMLIVLIASLRQESFLLDIAIIYALLGFIGITFMSIYIQTKGAKNE